MEIIKLLGNIPFPIFFSLNASVLKVTLEYRKYKQLHVIAVIQTVWHGMILVSEEL